MEMKQLESFVTACERGSISQAAACMYTTQPNVSKTIRTNWSMNWDGLFWSGAGRAYSLRFMGRPYWSMRS